MAASGRDPMVGRRWSGALQEAPSPAPASRRAVRAHRPRLGVAKFTSCDGCQLTLLDLEDQLLAIFDRVEVADFAEASSRRSPGPFDLLLVEGSVSTTEQAERLVDLRRQSRILVTIGACATAGGIQALRNWIDGDALRAAVYPRPDAVAALATATPIADHVAVDAELRGCPISPDDLLEFLTALLVGRRPHLPDQAVCTACKARGIPCLLVTRGLPCLGPVTRTGCGAICPAMGRACYGCFGPREAANVTSLARVFAARGRSSAEVGRLFAGFTAWAEAFRRAVTDSGWRPAPPSPPPGGSSGPPRDEGDDARY
jgi:sulfhydrogenase subunit delta